MNIFLFYIIVAVQQKTVARFLFIDGSQQQTIRRALSHWSEQTCIRFKEVDVDARVVGSHIQFSNASEGYVFSS